MRLSSLKILYIAFFRANFFNSEEQNLQENKKKNIEVIAIGKPSFKDLPHYQSEAFYTTLLKRITELATKGGK